MEVNGETEVGRARQRAERQRWNTFLTYWYGNLVSVVGDYLTLVALPIAAFRLSDSAVVAGAVEMMEVGATILFGTALGAIADRGNSVRLLALTDLVRSSAVGLLAIALAGDDASPWMVLAVSFLLGTMRCLHDGAESSLFARLIPPDLGVRAYSRLEASDSIGHLSGPTIGGTLAGVALPLCFAVDAASFAFAAAMVLLVSRRTPAIAATTAPDPDDTVLDQLRVAIRAIVAQKRYLQWVVVLCFSNLSVVGFGALLIPFAQRDLRVGPTVIGLLVSCGGVGGLLAVPLLDRQREVRLELGTWALLVVAMLATLAGVLATVWMVAIAIVSIGAGVAVSRSNSNAYRLELFPAEMQGRVQLATRTVLWSVTLLGIIVGALIADHIGARWVFIIFGATATLGIIVTGNIKVEVAPPPARQVV